MGYETHILPNDAELALAAQGGDCRCLGLLLERHRARLYATALNMLGYGSDAEDAVHETFLIALRRIGELKDPQAVAGWLRTVLHRCCLQQLRRRRREILTADIPDRPDERASIEEKLEKTALREWVWDALRKLPEPLQATAMLRYFGSYQSYEELAAILAVPIGTVRSRLSEAKRKLAEMLLETAGLVDADARSQSRSRQQFYFEIFNGLNRHGERDRFLGHFAEDLHLVRGSSEPVLGRSFLAGEVELRHGSRRPPRTAAHSQRQPRHRHRGAVHQSARRPIPLPAWRRPGDLSARRQGPTLASSSFAASAQKRG